MALIKLDHVMFKVFPHKQKIKIRPLELYRREEDGFTHIEYTCQICEQIGMKYNSTVDSVITKEFETFTFKKGTKRCPHCGIYLDWGYKKHKELF